MTRDEAHGVLKGVVRHRGGGKAPADFIGGAVTLFDALDAAGAFTPAISATDAGEILRILGSVRGGHAVSSAALVTLGLLSGGT